jgi:hypothetical protein
MADKKFEINLTPQNDEWIKLIPNASQNMDNVVNKMISAAINEGLFLEVISQSLTLADLSKFKSAYARLQTKRAEHMADLEITPTHTERRKVVQTQTVEVDSEDIIPEDLPSQKQKSTQSSSKKDTKKQLGHGFTEDSF